MKRIVSFVLCVLLIMSTGVVAFANEGSIAIQDLEREYSLKDVKELPKGVTPIEFSSDKELAAFLAKVNAEDSVVVETKAEEMKPSIFSLKSLMRSTRGSSIINWEKKKRNPFMSIILKAKIDVYSGGSFGQINSVENVVTHATGYTPGTEYTPDPYSTGFRIASDKQSVDIWGEGDMQYYLLTPSGGGYKLYTKRIEIEGTYRIR